MVSKVIWSSFARSDLFQIVRHIAQDRPDFAKAYCLDLIEKVEALAEFPMRGRQISKQSDLRELILPPYRVVYELVADAGVIHILRVWDARRGDPEVPSTRNRGL